MGLARLVLGWMRQVAGPVAARLRRLAGLGRLELRMEMDQGEARRAGPWRWWVNARRLWRSFLKISVSNR